MTRDTKDSIATIVGLFFAAGLSGLVVVLVAGFAVAKFWNFFAPELLGAPVACWKNGIGFVGFLMCISGSFFTIQGRK